MVSRRLLPWVAACSLAWVPSARSRAAEPPSATVAVLLGVAWPQARSSLSQSLAPTLEIAALLPGLEGRLAVAATLGTLQPHRHGLGVDPRLAGGTFAFALVQQEWLLGLAAVGRLRPPTALVNLYGKLGAVLHLQRLAGAGNAAGVAFGDAAEMTRRVGGLGAMGSELVFGPGRLLLEVALELSRLDGRLTGPAPGGAIFVQGGYRALF